MRQQHDIFAAAGPAWDCEAAGLSAAEDLPDIKQMFFSREKTYCLRNLCHRAQQTFLSRAFCQTLTCTLDHNGEMCARRHGS